MLGYLILLLAHLWKKTSSVIALYVVKSLDVTNTEPSEEWGIEGMLYGLCHLEKTKEFTLEQKEVPDICAIMQKRAR